jgi:hypothetical protein
MSHTAPGSQQNTYVRNQWQKNTNAAGVHAAKLQNFKFTLTDNVCLLT